MLRRFYTHNATGGRVYIEHPASSIEFLHHWLEANATI
jgi:hypothetical protein